MKQLISKYKQLSRLHKSAVWIATLFVCYTITGFLIVPPILNHIAVNSLTEFLDRPAAIEKVKLNPLTLSLTIEGFSIHEKNKAKPFVSFKKFYVNLQSISILRLAPVVKEVKLENPFIRIERFADNKYNFSDILEKTRSTPAKKTSETQSRPFYFALYNIALLGGGAEIIDDVVSEKHTVSGLDLTIPFISNQAEDIDVFVKPAFRVNINGTPLVLAGRTKPFSRTLETGLKIDLKKIDLPHYFGYLPIKTNLNLTSGKLDLAASINFHQAEDKTPAVSGEGILVVSDLAVADTAGDSFLNLSKLQVELDRSQFLKQDIHVKKVELSTPEVGIVRRKDGSLNIFSLLPAVAAKDSAAAPPAKADQPPSAFTCKLDELSMHKARIYLQDAFKTTTDTPPAPKDMLRLDDFALENILLTSVDNALTFGKVEINGGEFNIRRQPSDEFNFQALAPVPQASDAKQDVPPEKDQATTRSKEKKNAWNVTLSKFSVDKFDIHAKDLAAKDKGDLTVGDIQINAENISTQKERQGNLSLKCRINQDAEIDIQNRVQVTPLEVKSKIDVKNIHLAWGQPFIEKKANLVLKKGIFNLSGDASVTVDADSAPAVAFKGDVSVDNLLILDSAEKEKLLQLKLFRIEKLNAGYPEPSVNIAAVNLDGLTSRVTRKADGGINLADVIPAGAKTEPETPTKQNAPAARAEKPGDGLRLNIDTIRLTKSEVDFTDRSVEPYFATDLKGITLTINGISTTKKQPADVSFAAKQDGQAPLTVTGQLNPLSQNLFADLDSSFKDMELSPVSPYSGKYIGRKITKGKLSFDLNYLIKESKLTATNKILIDQIELGDPVSSPDAASLPVGLGIALLKDRSGRINLDIPVSGNLNDPKFSLSTTIMDVITNLLSKAATSPFSLLASMFGGGEDINLIYFEPGKATVSAAEQGKLDTVSKALFERPSLTIEIKGYADIKADKKALVDSQFNAMITAETGEQEQSPQAAAEAEPPRLPPEKYEKYVRRIYKRVKKEKKKTGKFEEPDDVTLAFMENIIREDIHTTDADLKLLAAKRAMAVKDDLLASKKIAAERIFIVAGDGLLAKENDTKVKSRVELGIK